MFRRMKLMLGCILLLGQFSFAQRIELTGAQRDSIARLIEQKLPDSVQVVNYYLLGDALIKIDPARAVNCLKKSYGIAIKTRNIKYIKRSLERLGVYYKDKGKFDQALSYQQAALKICESENDTFGIAVTCNNIGVIYKTIKDYPKALSYYTRSNQLCSLANKTQGYLMTLNNIGTIYSDQGLYDLAKPYYDKALVLSKEKGSKESMVVTLNNLGELLGSKNEHSKSLAYFQSCLKLDEELGDQFGILLDYINIAGALKNLNQLTLAEEFYEKARVLAVDLGAVTSLVDIYRNLSMLYETEGKSKQAFDAFNTHLAYKDSIFTKESSDQIASLEIEYQSEKKENEIAVLTKENEIKQTGNERKRIAINISLSALGLAAILMMVIWMLYRQKEAANLRLLQLDQEKNEFLGIAAHDLKNPLQTIIGYCQMQRDYFEKLTQDKILKYSQNIELSARRMVDLISNLLDINAIEEGRIVSKPEEFDMREVAGKIIQGFEYAAGQKKISIRFSQNEQSVYLVKNDRYMFTQVFENLLSNAIKYSPANKEVIIELHRDAVANRSGFSVIDQGPGMSEADQKKLFQKFTRLSAKPTGGESSNGLGLSIVKKLADLMQGTVSCKSSAGNGCTFTVMFPYVNAPA